MRRRLIFLVNLLQDVNILRPLAYLAAREFDADIVFAVSARFLKRDTRRLWQREIAEIAGDVDAATVVYDTPFDILRLTQGESGVMIAASESNLPGHADTHEAFQVTPSSFLKVTLQHGYECVGFLQNREHDIAHGRNVTFAADVICSWCDAAALTALVPSERSKLYVTGPSTLLQMQGSEAASASSRTGLVCENLHSVRLRTSGDFGTPFMEVFAQFCAAQAELGENVGLRPHPGGQYVLKNDVPLPPNVRLHNEPIYRTDLASFAFGISAPSSVLVDMLLAGLPTAVWGDAGGVMDLENYRGMVRIDDLPSWLDFARDAAKDREALQARQADALAKMAIVTDPKAVRSQFVSLLREGLQSGQPILSTAVTSLSVAEAPMASPRCVAADEVLRVAVEAESVATLSEVFARLLRRNPALTVDVTGAGDLPARLAEFGERVVRAIEAPGSTGAPDRHAAHVGVISADGEALGWREHTAAGTAVVARRGTAQAALCLDGCGLTAGPDEEWVAAIEELLDDDDRRRAMVQTAQERLRRSARLRTDGTKAVSRTELTHAMGGRASPWEAHRQKRLLVFCDAVGPTQQINFVQPLLEQIERDVVKLRLLDCPTTADAMLDEYSSFRPDVLILSRLTARNATPVIERARRDCVAVIFHIDDDLLNVPVTIGAQKFATYSSAERIATLRANMDAADVIYASTPELAETLAAQGVRRPIMVGALSSTVDPDAVRAPTWALQPTFGYMGSDSHAADLATLVPTIAALLDENPWLRFETFGSIKPLAELSRFGSRVAHHTPMRDYSLFLSKLETLGWWAGLAPLQDNSFNRCKTATKWIEYSLAGTPTIAQDMDVYRAACSGGAGILAENEDAWKDAVLQIIRSSKVRDAISTRAQQKLRDKYDHHALADQLERAFETAELFRRMPEDTPRIVRL